jgi:hypothetical protein
MDDQRKEAKNCDGWLLLIPYNRYSLLNPATFSSSLTRSLKQGTLKGHEKTAFPIRTMVVRGRQDKKAVTNEAVAHGSCTAVQSFTNMNLITNTFESFFQTCISHDGLFFLRVWIKKERGVFQRG